MKETCHCQFVEPMYCGDCNSTQFGLTEQEAELCRNALTYFVASYQSDGATQTKKEMARLDRKLRTMLKIHHQDQEDQRARQEAIQALIKKTNAFYQEGRPARAPRERG